MTLSLFFCFVSLFSSPPFLNGQDVISSSLPTVASLFHSQRLQTPLSWIFVYLCVCAALVCVRACVRVCACVCVCHSGVWTLTFLCFDNHRALCPSVPPAMTQGNVTCQSQTPTYNRCPPYLSPPTPPTWNTTARPPPTHPDPNCSSPGPHLGDKGLTVSPFPLLLSSSPLPHMTPYPPALLLATHPLLPLTFAPRTLEYGTGRQHTQ